MIPPDVLQGLRSGPLFNGQDTILIAPPKSKVQGSAKAPYSGAEQCNTPEHTLWSPFLKMETTTTTTTVCHSTDAILYGQVTLKRCVSQDTGSISG